ncbi:hypothetical protein GTP45_12715 [Pseudoduganella sp. FT55W]|uniref:Uncharacterized protein n=1 Tax=Duganella rivi TaxID=2666083 RepID=A0A7X4GQC6_9BURK|nr:polymorphic toxin type 10 domain-containing protein [Duganella rivi]MYM67691.1 hypothetical protein [Duganella rivi]
MHTHIAQACRSLLLVIVRGLLVLMMFCAAQPALAQNGAQFVSQSVSSSMDIGTSYSVSVRMKNIGTTTWTPDTYGLGAQAPANNWDWGVARVPLSTSVAPGETYTFRFSVKRAAPAGVYNFQWQVVQENVEWFGDTSPLVSVVVSQPGNPLPTLTVTRNPSPMVLGRTYSITWNSTNATSVSNACTVDHPGPGYSGSSTFPPSGTLTNLETFADGIDNPSTCVWTATGPGGSAQVTEKMITVLPPAPTLTVKRNPSPMELGKTYSLTWSSTNATSVKNDCRVDHPGPGYSGTSTFAPNGSLTNLETYADSVGNPSTCVWTAYGFGGTATVTERMETIIPPPTLTVTRNPSPMVVGKTYSLSWDSTNATSVSNDCTADHAGPGYSGSSTFAPSGSLTNLETFAERVGNPSTCVWTAVGPGGTKKVTEKMETIVKPPTLTVTRTPSPMAAGQNYTLTWASTGATSVTSVCTASGTGFNGTNSWDANGTMTATANPAWANYPSTCIWTAEGPTGKTTVTQTMTTSPPKAISAECLAVTPASGSFTAATGGGLWGNNSAGYSTDSSIPTALIHSGLLKAGESAFVNVLPLDTLKKLNGTTANGVTSSSWDEPWCGMRLSLAPQPTISVKRTPAVMVVGQPATVTWSSSNAAGWARSCTANGPGYTGYSTLPASGSETITPNASWVDNPSTCTWSTTGPGNPGSYVETVATAAVGGGASDARFVSQDVPTIMSPGKTYPVTIRMLNTGTATWTAGNNYRLGNLDDSLTWGVNRALLTSSVAPGQIAEFKMTVTAPFVSGVVPFQWQMLQEQVGRFGAVTPDAAVVVSGFNAPAATLSVSPNNVRVAGTAKATLTFKGSATETGRVIKTLEVSQRQYGSSSVVQLPPVKNGTGASLSLPANYTVAVPAGLYTFQLRGIDDAGNDGFSPPVIVNVTNSSLLGLISGVRIDADNKPRLIGWICQPSVSQALNYQVLLDAPTTDLGGILLTSGVANVATEPDNAAVQSQCQTPGSAHHFNVDLSGYTARYPGRTLYVKAPAYSGSDSLVLPCADNTCTMPGALRVGITTPTQGQSFVLPNPAFLRMKVTGLAGSLDEVGFYVNGSWIAATAEADAPGAYSVSKALAASATPYVVYAKIRQGNTTLFSAQSQFNVVSASAAIITSPLPNTTITVGSQLLLKANAPTNAQTLKFFANSIFIGDAVKSNDEWTYTWKPLAAKTYSIKAVAYDVAGTVISESIPVTVVVTSSTSQPLVGINIPTPHLGNPNAGSLPGTMTVGPNGEAVYSIPIDVPPGTADIEPDLTLNYSSTSPNGVLGMGWSLSGLSYIERCAKTIAQDGVYGRISLNNSDRLCLDGQRLIRVDGDNSDDSYWSVGTTYRTESDIFARISRQADGGFKVEWRDGRISYFGLDANAALPSQGAVKWGLSRTEDRKGNYLTVSYNACTTGGECQPAAIRYGGYAKGTTQRMPDIAVRFDYDDSRPDVQLAYIGGVRVDTAKRMSHIRTYIDTAADGTGGTLVRDYGIHYIQSETGGRSLIDWIELKAVNPADGTIETLPRTDFKWGLGGAPTLKATSVAPFVLPYFPGRDPSRLQGDVDGSGRTSFVALQAIACGLSNEPPCVDPTIQPHLTGAVKIRAPNGNESETTLDIDAMGIKSTFAYGANSAYMSDLNGDGFDDIVLADTTNKKWGYCINNAKGAPVTFSCQAGGDGTPAPVNLRGDRKAHLIGKINRDGIARDCTYVNGAMSCSDLKFNGMPSLLTSEPSLTSFDFLNINEISLSRQPKSDFYSVWGTLVPAANPADPYEIRSPDQRLDRINGVTICFNQIDGMACNTPVQSKSVGKTLLTVDSADQTGDFNGDGLTDFIYSIRNAGANNGRYICLSKENGVDCKPDTSLNSFAPFYDTTSADATSGAKIADLLGDGVTRLLFNTARTSIEGPFTPKTYLCAYGVAGFSCDLIARTIESVPESQTVFIDDSGVPALLIKTGSDINGKPAWVPMTLVAPAAMDRIVWVKNGIGHETEVDYARGDDPAVYVRKPIVNGQVLAPTYPAAFVAPGVMVKQLRETSGGAGKLVKNYQYGGALEDVTGRGSLGMAVVKESDPDTKIENTVYYSQAYPTVGLPLRQLVQSVRGRTIDLSDTSTDYTIVATVPMAPQVQWVLATSITSVQKDLSGADMGTEVVKIDDYDTYGNVLQKTATSSAAGGTFVSTVVTPVIPDTTNWLVGLPSSLTETRAGPVGDPIQRKIDFTYKDGLLDTEIVENNTPLRVKTTHGRTAFGLEEALTQEWTDPKGVAQSREVVRRIFDTAKGRFAEKISNALGHTDSLLYNAQTGLPKSRTDANQQKTEYTYDAFGRIKKAKFANANETLSYYKQCVNDSACPAGATTVGVREYSRGTDHIAVPEARYLNAAGKPVSISTWGSQGRQIVVDYGYDNLGRLDKVYRPRFVNDIAYIAASYEYDDLGRVTGVTRWDENNTPQKSIVKFDGLLTTYQNPELFETVETRDVQGHLIEVKDAAGKFTKMGYDAFGNLKTTEDPNGNIVTVKYDNLGRKTDLSDPDLGWIHYDVDAVGRVYQQTSPEDRLAQGLTTFEYDKLDRMTRRLERDLDSRWVFDTELPSTAPAKGKLVSASTWKKSPAVADYERTYEYDAFGNPKEIRRTSANGIHVSTYKYDAWGRLSSESAAPSIGKSKTFVRRYDDMGQLAGLERDGVILWSIADADAAGRPMLTQLGNGLTEKREFNPYSGRLTKINVLKGASPLLQQNYAYNPRGLLSHRDAFWPGASFMEDFTYDGLNRLATSTVGSVRLQYGYDEAGNLKHKDDLSTTEDYTYFSQKLGEGSLPHAVKRLPGSSADFAYDKNGNLRNGAGRQLTWKSFNMPATITKGSFTSTFTYGAEHQRVRQDRAGGANPISTEYLGMQQLESVSNKVTATRSYWPIGNGVDVDVEAGAANTRWMHVDAQGSVMAISDENGDIKESTAYDPWGKRRELGGVPAGRGSATPDVIDGVLDSTGYTGEEMLDQLDLVHLNGRVYDPGIGRFISADPFVTDWSNGQSLNRYSYVLNSPLNYTDPSGYEEQSVPSVVVTGSLNGALGSSGGSIGAGSSSSIAGSKQGPAATVTVRGKSQSANSGFKDHSRRSLGDPLQGIVQEFHDYGTNGNGEQILGTSARRVEMTDHASGQVGTMIGIAASGLPVDRAVVGIYRGYQFVNAARAAKSVANPISNTFARVVPRGLKPTTLAKPGDLDVFVTNASELRGLSNAQIAEKLTIPELPGGFKVIEFPSAGIEGIASPVFRTNPGFIQGGRTAGGAAEFVIPNGPIPSGAIEWIPH